MRSRDLLDSGAAGWWRINTEGLRSEHQQQQGATSPPLLRLVAPTGDCRRLTQPQRASALSAAWDQGQGHKSDGWSVSPGLETAWRRLGGGLKAA